MSRTIVQIIRASELRAGDVIVNVHEDTRRTVTDIAREMRGAALTVTFADRSADFFTTGERVIVEPRGRSIMVYRTRWIPTDDGHGGTTEPNYRDDTSEEVIDCEDGADTIDTTALRLRDLGVFGDEERLEMYRDPDGSRIIDYATGEREEVTAVLRDFSDEDQFTIRVHIGMV